MKKYDYSGYNALNTALDKAIAVGICQEERYRLRGESSQMLGKDLHRQVDTLDDKLNNAGCLVRALKVTFRVIYPFTSRNNRNKGLRSFAFLQ